MVGQSEIISKDNLKPGNVVTDECVYLGQLYTHYGHHFVISIARAWFMLQRPSCKVVFHAYIDVDELFEKQFVRQNF